jgi:type IV pilus assembly protein PilA
MLTMLQKRLNRDEDGFTLIELMVVILIIAVLMAIAIPTFLGAQDRAKDRAAQSDLRNGLSAAKVLATDSAGLFVQPGTTTALTSTDLGTAEPSLSFVAMSAVAAKKIGVVVESSTATPPVVGSYITLETMSANGHVFAIATDSNGVVKYCKSTSATAKADCDTWAEMTASSW